ncbi:hypothetical protein TNCV_1110401 [Trichonephila clavipes]|nr:hypothetical protein TNCV_1110401 [Trichonephila clavipes]
MKVAVDCKPKTILPLTTQGQSLPIHKRIQHSFHSEVSGHLSYSPDLSSYYYHEFCLLKIPWHQEVCDAAEEWLNLINLLHGKYRKLGTVL